MNANTRPPSRPTVARWRRLVARQERAWAQGYATGKRAERALRDHLDDVLNALLRDDEEPA